MRFPSWAVISGRTDIEACNPPTADEIRGASWWFNGAACVGAGLFFFAWYLVANHIATGLGLTLLWVCVSLFMSFAFYVTRSHSVFASLSSEEDLQRLRSCGDLNSATLAYIHRVNTLGRRLTEREAKVIIANVINELRLRARKELYAAPSDQAKD
ncbi:TPA: hypothetical protein ACGW3M_001063 [Pseudomonas aeruginosa]|uniref:hypothetical protein n=1 Tax=Pseudomonas aeruginosa TaxID=287 RepID=UPI0027F47ABD|nr:hypothetical protein [Pseudomonas aeruginosa]ELJ2276121.1 hypothetical protein [Pseudomonas aeruginosa]